jgi:hypothetical protein
MGSSQLPGKCENKAYPRCRGRAFRSMAFRLFALLSFSLLLLLSGCGLEQVFIQLIPPEPDYESGVQYFKFKKVTDGTDVEPEFLGFELYYRFFEDGESIVFVNTFEEFAAKGYRRVYSSSDRVGTITRPLIRVYDTAAPNDRERTFTVTVDFTNAGDADYPLISDDADPALHIPIDVQDIRRGVTYSKVGQTDVYKSFWDFEQEDKDISGIDWTSFQTKGTLVLYVLSYGKDEISYRDLYSEPVYLGDITQDFVKYEQ